MDPSICSFSILLMLKLACGRVSLNEKRGEEERERGRGVESKQLIVKGIPYAKLIASAAVDSKPTKTSSSVLSFSPSSSLNPSGLLIPYQEVFIKQDTILVHERSFIEDPSLSPKPSPSLSPNAFLDSYHDKSSSASPSPFHSHYLDTHPYPNAYPNAHTSTPGQVSISPLYILFLLILLSLFIIF